MSDTQGRDVALAVDEVLEAAGVLALLLELVLYPIHAGAELRHVIPQSLDERVPVSDRVASLLRLDLASLPLVQPDPRPPRTNGSDHRRDASQKRPRR